MFLREDQGALGNEEEAMLKRGYRDFFIATEENGENFVPLLFESKRNHPENDKEAEEDHE